MNEIVSLLISMFGMIATTGAAIAALASSYIAKKSLQEQKENNNIAYKPFMVIEGKEFEFELQEGKPFDKLNWQTNEYNLQKNGVPFSYTNLLNINKGVARNIVVKFSIQNANTFLRILKENNKSRELNFLEYFIAEHKNLPGDLALYVNGIFTSSVEEITSHSLYEINNIPDQRFLFLQNVNQGVEKIQIPIGFIALMNLLFHIQPKHIDLESLPKLKISISCEDIIGQTINYNYLFKVNRYILNTSIYHSDKVRITFKSVEC